MAQLNMTLLGEKTYSEELNDIWGYVDSLGNEYALVGAQDGVSVVDVTDPTDPKEIWWFDGPFSTWRDLKVWNKHCYVTNESNQGLFIIDLSNLPDTTTPSTTWHSGSTFPFNKAHNLFIDENGVAYIMGADLSNGGAIMLDVDTDPMNPIELGLFDTYYLHDGMARGDTLWGSAINNGFFVVIDISNKGNPIILATQNTPSNFTHNAWISDDGDFLYTTDEKSGAYLGAYDVSDLGNISEVDRIQSNPGTGTIPHNTHFMNDYIITSYYRDGITVHDVTEPDNMIEVANFDTYSGSGNGFNGAWGVYPWLPSGNILVSNIEDGLSVHGISYVRGCYLHGIVTDFFTSNPIPNVSVVFLGTSMNGKTDITGNYKTGVADATIYEVEFSAPGYIADTLVAIMVNGSITVLDATLLSRPSFAQTGTVTNASTGNPISGATVSIVSAEFTFDLTTDGSGNFNAPTFYEGLYEVNVGKWGYGTSCSMNFSIDDQTGNITYELDEGYYDDFALDLGWTIASSAAKGIWEIGEPLGTTYNGNPANPDQDVVGGCSDKAYITGNNGSGVGDDDVDNGFTEIKSPIMDLMNYNDPYIEYYRWFFNAAGNGPIDDTLKISITDGTTTVLLEQIADTFPVASWNYASFRVLDYLPLSSTIRLIVNVGDANSGSQNLVEAGFDAFQVVGLVSVPKVSNGKVALTANPNPFSASLEVNYDYMEFGGKSVRLEMRDVAGRVVHIENLSASDGKITLNTDLAKGVYMLQLISDGEVLKSLKVVKG